METRHITAIHQNKLANISLAILLGSTLLSSTAQASIESSDSLLPPTTTQMLEQAEPQQNKALTQSEIIDQATSQSAATHVITKNKDGSVRIPSPMQDVIATLTAKGAHIYSDDEAGETFALLVNGLGREDKLSKIQPGKITSDEKIARLFHNNLTEEFSTSSEGIRQDFVISQSPKGMGKLIVELDIEGATARLDNKGAMLTLKSGRELAYHNLMVADASGKTLSAHFGVKDKQTLHIIVDDNDAEYPVRIDPTSTDSDWFSLGAAVPAPIGDINALVSDGAGNLYLGGSFSEISGIPNTAYIAKWDGSSWSTLDSAMNATVTALAWDGNNLYAGGDFTTAGGASANHIAKWDGTSWSTLGSGINRNSGLAVNALAWDGTNLYAGGRFTTAGGVSANNIAQWDGTNWSALGSGVGVSAQADEIYALVWASSDLYVGGEFTTAGGISANYIAQWDGTSWSALGSGMNKSFGQIDVTALAWDGNNLYAGGHFDSANGVSATNIAQWDGTNWSALGSGISGEVKALAWNGSTLTAGGIVSVAGGTVVSRIAQWDGATWSALGSGITSSESTVQSYINALAWNGGNLYAGGRFSNAGEVVVHNIAQWNGSIWSAPTSFLNGTDYGPNSLILALISDGNNLYAGGDFSKTGSVSTNNIAKWDGSIWRSLGTGMNDTVRTLALDGTNLYAGGNFTTAGGINANRIAKWDGASWSALGTGVNDIVYALAWDGTNLYAGGDFTTAGGISANYVAQWDGTSWSALGLGVANGNVTALVWNDNILYAGIIGSASGSVQYWDGTSWSRLGNLFDNPVTSLVWGGNKLYAGGWFESIGSAEAYHIAQWDSISWSAVGLGVNHYVTALAWDGSNLYAAGRFTVANWNFNNTKNGVDANRIAQWDGTSWTALGSGVNEQVYALVWDGINLYAGGNFTSAGDKEAGYVAGINFTIPDPLVLTDLTDIALNTLTSSDVLNITGILIDVDISITGGEYSLNGGAWTSAAGTASNNDSLQLRTTSSASYNTTTDVVVTVGSSSDTWSLTTLTDTVPDTFAFIDQTGAALSTLTTSNTATIAGLGASSAVSISGGEYSLNGDVYTSIAGLINNNDTVAVRTTSSASFNTALDVVLTIGGISDTFTVTTEVDTDADGVGDNADAFPNDATETGDTDGDGVGNNADAFPTDATETGDTDGDGVGDNADAFPNDATETDDTDGDGVGTNADAFPNDATETGDTDGDGVGNNADAFPTDATETGDTDGDGVGDNIDAFPTNNAVSVDANNNGKPDEWNTACDSACQSSSNLTLDGSDDGGGSTNPLLLGLLSLFIISLRRRVKLYP